MDEHGEGLYLEVKMPERFLLQFRLEDGSWMDEAVCLRRRFERLDNGSYICSEFSSGLRIRCVADHERIRNLVSSGATREGASASLTKSVLLRAECSSDSQLSASSRDAGTRESATAEVGHLGGLENR
jgi:hypothetical protein